MDIADLKKYQPPMIILLLFFFMGVAFLLRILPAIVMQHQTFYPIFDTDTWYNLRQIEVMVHNFPQYNWFDPMTAYPAGKLIDWGPLYPFLAAVLCLLTGAVTRDGIIEISGFVSPLLAMLTVPIVYVLGKKLRDTITGIVAAGFVSITSLLYFSFSSYGMIDHHITETFFSTLFFLTYIHALAYARQNTIDIRKRETLPYFCLVSALAGVIYFLGLITSTTLILCLLIIVIYTFVQGLVDFYYGNNFDYLCILNIVLISVTTILLIFFGFKRGGVSFFQYSAGLVYLLLTLVAETVVIRILAEIFQKRRVGFFISIAGLCAGILIIVLIIPSLRLISLQALNLLFGSSVFTVGVEETLPWSWAGAYDAVNVGIFLAAGGFLVLGYSLWKRQEREQIFFAVWSVLMLLITVQHQRFLYYFTINIVLLAGICITEPLRWENNPARPFLLSFFPQTGERGTTGKPREKTPAAIQSGKRTKSGNMPGKSRKSMVFLSVICIFAVFLLTIIHVALSIQQDYQYGMSAGDRVIPPDWLESLSWISRNTPDPGIDYFGQYDSKGYTPPTGSYGIMAVWDAGHWITFFAHRLPITNPFQDNLGGNSGTAAFFLAENESKATDILKTYRGRYIITDSTMAIDQFTNLVPWQSGSVDISHYIKWFLVSDAADHLYLKKVHLFDNGYYQSMVVRLHNFDGSMTEPSTAQYTTYTIRQPTPQETAEASGYSRVIADQKTLAVSRMDNTTPLFPEGTELLPMTYTALFSDMPDKPVQTVPALQHFRLIHESADNSSVVPFPESGPIALPGIKMVKIFEYVPGAHIPGTGIIELPVITNTGRTFTYRQESIGGGFIVPYSTTGNPYEVHATGPYHIVGTGQYVTVTEQEVTGGMLVAGSE